MFPDLLDILDAFIILSSGRQVGFGISPISLSEIFSYCQLFVIDDVDRFVRLIRAMDMAFVQKVEKRNKQKEKSVNGNKTRHHNR